MEEGFKDGSAGEVKIWATITRPSEEADRKFWNSQLAFADLPWMDEVRIWDDNSQWQWPNLPYLLRLHGEERIERYGGVDPAKHVDNDFAAVLIRKYDASGANEAAETKHSPLVSAEWGAEGIRDTDARTVVHVAKSDVFVLQLGNANQRARGKLKIWLIYADFLGASPPPTWPRKGEWAGGVLAYLEIDWQKSPGQPSRAVVRHKRPERGTEFDWMQWTSRSAGLSRLIDKPKKPPGDS